MAEELKYRLIGSALTAVGMIVGATMFITSMDVRISQTDAKIGLLSQQIEAFATSQNTINQSFFSNDKIYLMDVQELQSRMDSCSCRKT